MSFMWSRTRAYLPTAIHASSMEKRTTLATQFYPVARNGSYSSIYFVAILYYSSRKVYSVSDHRSTIMSFFVVFIRRRGIHFSNFRCHFDMKLKRKKKSDRDIYKHILTVGLQQRVWESFVAGRAATTRMPTVEMCVGPRVIPTTTLSTTITTTTRYTLKKTSKRRLSMHSLRSPKNFPMDTALHHDL